jgi:hypothetical protein
MPPGRVISETVCADGEDGAVSKADEEIFTRKGGIDKSIDAKQSQFIPDVLRQS